MEKIKFVDAHTHTQFWDEEHFKELDSSAVLFSLDSHIRIPKKTDVSKKRNIIFGYGLQPFTLLDSRSLNHYLDSLVKDISKENIMLLGELGMDHDSLLEEKLLYEQLVIAREYKLPVIVHTPKDNKLAIYRKIMQVINRSKLDPSSCLIDHINRDLINEQEPDFYIGITIQENYGKLSLEEAKRVILDNYGLSGRLIVNSDYSNLKCRKQLVGEVNTVRSLQESLAEIDTKLAIKVTLENALKFIGIQGWD